MDNTDVPSAQDSYLQGPSSALSTEETLRDSCRSCLSQAMSGKPFLWKLQDRIIDQNVTLIELYKLLMGIEVNVDDNLPQSFCSKCAEELLGFHSFRNRCIQSETTLRGLIFETAKASHTEDNGTGEETDSPETDQMEPESKITSGNEDIVHIENNEMKQDVDYHIASNDRCNEATDEIKEECSLSQVTANSHQVQIEDVGSIATSSNTNPQTGYVIVQSRPQISGFIPNLIFPTIRILTVPLVTSRVMNAPPPQEKVKADVPKCHICGKSFQFPSRLRDHIATHTNERPHSCSICPQRFNSRRSIHSHMKTHTGDKPHVCDACGKAFAQKNALTEHRRIHTGEKPNLCTRCGKSFRHRNALVGHLKTHSLDMNGTRVEFFRCRFCSRFFNSESLLQQHEHKMHFSKEKPKLLCSECGRSFASVSGLRGHLKVHTGERPHQCDYCGKTFTSTGLLKKHTRCHTGEKPYACKVCSRRFSQSAHLRYHLSSHNDGVKAFSCDKCGKAFAYRATLNRHILTHTRESPYVCSLCPKRFHHDKSRRKHEERHEAEGSVAQEAP